MHENRLLLRACILAASLVLFSESTKAGKFEYQGLSARTTLEELRDQFPDLSFSHTSLQFTDPSSISLVREIRITTSMVRVFFVSNASCDKVVADLVRNNGPPDESEEFPIVATPNRLLVWQSVAENMALRCHQKDNRFLAEALSFTNDFRTLNSVIEAVVEAASTRNYDRLEALMTGDFLVSFGVGRSRDASLEWIKLRQPEILETMLDIPAMDCEYVEYDQTTYYECSANKTEGYRAGFRRVNPLYWRFAWFVSGD